MARIRRWVTKRMNPPSPGPTGTLDLLEDVQPVAAGTTVQRVIVRLDVEYTRQQGHGFPRCEFGVMAGTEPLVPDVFGVPDADWLTYRSFVVLPAGAAPGTRVHSDLGSELTSSDVAGQRVLMSGDGVWLARQVAFDDPAGTYFVHIASRTLLLGPDQ